MDMEEVVVWRKGWWGGGGDEVSHAHTTLVQALRHRNLAILGLALPRFNRKCICCDMVVALMLSSTYTSVTS